MDTKFIALVMALLLILTGVFSSCTSSENENILSENEITSSENEDTTSNENEDVLNENEDISNENEDVSNENEDTSSIVGKWKLEVVYFLDLTDISPKHLDYSQNDIIYDFKENNVLIVSGKMDNIGDYRGYTKGEHSYEMLPIPPSGPAGPCPAGIPIKIDTETLFISFGWVFFDSYEGSAMHISTQNGTLVLSRVGKTG